MADESRFKRYSLERSLALDVVYRRRMAKQPTDLPTLIGGEVGPDPLAQGWPPAPRRAHGPPRP